MAARRCAVSRLEVAQSSNAQGDAQAQNGWLPLKVLAVIFVRTCVILSRAQVKGDGTNYIVDLKRGQLDEGLMQKLLRRGPRR